MGTALKGGEGGDLDAEGRMVEQNAWGGGGEDPPELIGAFDCSLDRGERDEPSGDVCGHISCVP